MNIASAQSVNDDAADLERLLNFVDDEEAAEVINCNLLSKRDLSLLLAILAKKKAMSNELITREQYDREMSEMTKGLEKEYVDFKEKHEVQENRIYQATDPHYGRIFPGAVRLMLKMEVSETFSSTPGNWRDFLEEFHDAVNDFNSLNHAIIWSYNKSKIDEVKAGNYLPECLLDEDALNVYRAVCKGRLARLIIKNEHFWKFSSH